MAAAGTSVGQPPQASSPGSAAAVGYDVRAVQSALASVRSIAGDKGSLGQPSQAEKTLTLLQKMMSNPLLHPEEEKFRRVRQSIPAVQANIVSIPGAATLLTQFGFMDTLDTGVGQTGQAEAVYLLPAGATEHSGVLRAVERELLSVQALYDSNKAAQWSGLQAREKQKAAAEAEKQRILEQAKKDREERKHYEEITGGAHASRAVERKFGAEAHRAVGRSGWA